MDPEGAAIEQLHKKGTFLGRSWGAEQESQQKKKKEWTGSAVVKALEQECQCSDSASSKVYDLGRLHNPLYLGLPSVKWEIISTSHCKGLHHVKT